MTSCCSGRPAWERRWSDWPPFQTSSPCGGNSSSSLLSFVFNCLLMNDSSIQWRSLLTVSQIVSTSIASFFQKTFVDHSADVSLRLETMITFAQNEYWDCAQVPLLQTSPGGHQIFAKGHSLADLHITFKDEYRWILLSTWYSCQGINYLSGRWSFVWNRARSSGDSASGVSLLSLSAILSGTLKHSPADNCSQKLAACLDDW